MPTPFDPETVLARPLMAMLATVSAAGPRIAPMWFVWEERALWLPSDSTSSSAGRIAEDARVAVEIVHFDMPDGVLLHLGVRGTAELLPMEPDRFRRLLAKYLGPEEAVWNPWFVQEVARLDDPSGRWIRVTPESTFTNNVSFFRTGPDLAWS